MRSRDKSEARYDDGVVDIRANAITLKKEVPFYTDPVTSQRAKLYTLELDRGLEWPKVRVRVRVRATATVTVTVTVTLWLGSGLGLGLGLLASAASTGRHQERGLASEPASRGTGGYAPAG